jgi:hypothetical protein
MRHTRHNARRIVTRRFEIKSPDHAIVDDDVTADDEVAQTRAAGRRHRPEQRIVQAEIARMRQLKNGEVDEREPFRQFRPPGVAASNERRRST